MEISGEVFWFKTSRLENSLKIWWEKKKRGLTMFNHLTQQNIVDPFDLGLPAVSVSAWSSSA
jgi:hypothetical protein